VGEVSWGGVVDFGGAAFCFEASVGFGPGWEGGGFLGPMGDRGFVAPVKKFAHGAAVSVGDHESLHRGFGGPKGGGPESVAAVTQQLDCEIAFGAGGLPRGAKRVNEEHRQEAPGTDAQACDGDEGHV